MKASDSLVRAIWRSMERVAYYPFVFPHEQRIRDAISKVGGINIDFHTHTIFSDGFNTPHYNVVVAARRGLEGIAITDHDTHAHFDECEKAARRFYKDPKGKRVKMMVIPGIEITAQKLLGNRIFPAHLVAIYDSYGVTPEIRKLVKLANRAKQELGKIGERSLSIEEAIDLMRESNARVIAPHYWNIYGVGREKLAKLGKRIDAYEVYNVSSGMMDPRGDPGLKIARVGNSDAHWGRANVGIASTIFPGVKEEAQEMKLESILEAIDRRETKPCLCIRDNYIANLEKFGYIHLARDLTALLEYLDDEHRVLAERTNSILMGREERRLDGTIIH
jgi:predicted metal-dependent phosphoesterase TrpH